MKKPDIIAQLEEEYKRILAVAEKHNEPYNLTLEEYIRNEHDKKINARPSKSGGMLASPSPSYAEIKEYEKAVDYIDNKNKSKSTQEKQGTARQLALAFHFMVSAKHLPKGTLDSSKNAEFIQFLTGVGSDNIRKKLGSISNQEVKGISTEKETKSLINDLRITRNIFDKVLFEKEVSMIDEYIQKLENDLIDLSET